jgi:hypothetical protein
MSAEETLGRQFTPNHKFAWNKAGKKQDSFISCCFHMAEPTGKPGANKWSLRGSKKDYGNFPSASAAKEVAKQLHESGEHGYS